jgi:hypothetical protein
MESKVLRLMAQLGLLAVLIWVVAAAMGKRSDLSDSAKKCGPGRRNRGVWAPSIVAAPMAQGAATMPVSIGPQTRY